ncbi:MAG: ribonuclease HI [Bryobacteraceae bacterium]|nr:ribonuclease HI [Bryobacteraceae bacterium]
MKKVELITDGACLQNPGPGGWACILRYGAASKELYGYAPATTNNRMELMAAIQGLLALKQPCEVAVTTDSEYLLKGVTEWMAGWKRRNWWRKRNPIPNADLWMELDHLVSRHQTQWLWTRGHSGHPDNERCDHLAETAAAQQRSSWPDNRPHAALTLGLGPDYVPPRPQESLFGAMDDDDNA